MAPYHYQLLAVDEIMNTRIPRNTSIAPNEIPRQRMNILLKGEKELEYKSSFDPTASFIRLQIHPPHSQPCFLHIITTLVVRPASKILTLLRLHTCESLRSRHHGNKRPHDARSRRRSNQRRLLYLALSAKPRRIRRLPSPLPCLIHLHVLENLEDQGPLLHCLRNWMLM